MGTFIQILKILKTHFQSNCRIQKVRKYHYNKRKMKIRKMSFHDVNNDKTNKEIRSLNENKGTQKSDIPTKIFNDNANIFA